MIYAIIEHKNNTLIMEFPCRRMTMAEHLASVGIRTPAHNIKCADEETNPVRVKIFGESEFGKKLASVISDEDTLSLVNSFCEMYQNMPYANKQDIMEAVLQDKVGSLREFGQRMMQRREQDVTEHYYCPLSAMVYPRNDYGDLEDYPDEYDGSYLAVYEDKIRELVKKEESRDTENLAEYFDGSNSAAAKLKEIHFSTQNVSGILYGCIRVELTEALTPDEEEEIKDFLTGQCSDGLGESLEQREIRVEDGDMYKEPYEMVIPEGLESLQQAVGGIIDCTYPFDDNTFVISNDEAKCMGLDGNRRIYGSIYAGVFLIAADDGYGGTADLTDAQVEKYTEMFREPEDISPEEVQDDMGFTVICY